MERYTRNRIYVTESEQELVRNTRIFLGGAGIGSICRQRFGLQGQDAICL